MAVEKSKVIVEHLEVNQGSSFGLHHTKKSNPNENQRWHLHPELELVYIRRGRGRRHIGNHLSYFKGGDLILIGSNLPHAGYKDRLTIDNNEVVMQFTEEFLGATFFDIKETIHIKHLFQKAKNGMTFFGETRMLVGDILCTMIEQEEFDRMISSIQLLNILAKSESYKSLNAALPSFEFNAKDKERIQLIYSYVRQHFSESISLDDIADLVNLTPQALSRNFKKITKKTVVEFINEFRVIHACKLLIETSKPITEICYDCGFNNFSNFNAQFKRFAHQTPSDYRKVALQDLELFID